LERVSFLRNRNTLSILYLAHVLVGEPASTSPDVRLAGNRGRRGFFSNLPGFSWKF
jgi:hypothetical protein